MSQNPGSIMGHCHLFPGGLGESRRDEFGIPGTSVHLVKLLGACGFDQAQVLAPHEDPPDASVKARTRPGREGTKWLLEQDHVELDSTAVLLPAATIRPHGPDAVPKLQEARASGVRMLKFHPLIMRCDPLLPVCSPFFEAAAEAGMLVTYHTGGGRWNWTDEGGRPEVCAALARRHPGLPILMAHCGTFGGTDGFDAAVATCEEHPSLFLETSAALLTLGADRWKEALDRLGPERVIYGSDYPFASLSRIEEELALLEELGLDAADKARMLGGNLHGLLEAAGA